MDSIIRGFPVPIVLLAETARREDNFLEIIDGMQRLDAIVSFISNKYSVEGHYFDLNAIAVSKSLLDKGELTQREPIMERGQCVRIASYPLPLSIYEFADDNAVDTVFRRINSGGRQLSRQELRSAGSTGAFATAVRRISAKVRGDDSANDILRLNEMQAISITNKDLDYGIAIEDVFWVKHGVLSRDNVRQSRDEELVADLLAYMINDDPVPSRTEYLDEYFGISPDEQESDRYKMIEQLIEKRSPSLAVNDFQRTLDQIKLTLDSSGQTFTQLIFSNPVAPSPRYFQVVFLAFHDLVVKKNYEISDYSALISGLKNFGDTFNIQEGGRWGAENRQRNVDSVVGIIQKAFTASSTIDPAQIHWVTQFENLLQQSYTEQAAYDFKQGFLTLENSPKFDEDSFTKILKTCAGIANISPGHKGYILVGVAENEGTAERIKILFGEQPRIYSRFYIGGVEHEANFLKKSLDDLFIDVVNRVSNSDISEPLRSYITAHLKCVRYYDKTVFVFQICGQENPSLYGSQYFERCGPQLKEVAPEDFANLFARYKA
ncbi:DUF262 domain-containing protein [Sphingosinicella xenopeptidilytica]|uniref:DUF262 domain-containing protein n=1 Tax=Sphingosinicella xenopeptidilytica TaxID=364098 RepID=A0ABW3C620_SPHXN